MTRTMGVATAAAVAVVLSSYSSDLRALEISVVNQTAEDAYVRFGLSNPTGTFNGTPLTGDESLMIAKNGHLSGLDVTHLSAGKLLFSLGKPLSSRNPDFQARSAQQDVPKRWDKVELTLDGTPFSAANLSSTDFFGVGLKVETFKSGSTTPLQTLTWKKPASEVFATAAPLSGNNADSVVKGTDGITVPNVGDVLRVIAPSALDPTQPNPYGSFQPYIDAVKGTNTHITGQYFGRGGSTDPRFEAQTFDFTATIDPTTGDLRMTGSGSVLGPNQVIEVKAADLAQGINTADPPYTYNGTPGRIGIDNDFYSAALRDMLGGFNLGLVGSKAVDPRTKKQYRDESSGEWFMVDSNFRPTLEAKYAFGFAQPDNPNFYNQFAAVIAEVSDSYGFPFTDLLGRALASLDASTVDAMRITILPDTASVFTWQDGLTGPQSFNDADNWTLDPAEPQPRAPGTKEFDRVVFEGPVNVDLAVAPNTAVNAITLAGAATFATEVTLDGAGKALTTYALHVEGEETGAGRGTALLTLANGASIHAEMATIGTLGTIHLDQGDAHVGSMAIEDGGMLKGVGTVVGDVAVAQGGTVAGTGGIQIQGSLSGHGQLTGMVTVNGATSAGNSAGLMVFETLVFGPDHVLTKHLGGLSAGDEHDHLAGFGTGLAGLGPDGQDVASIVLDGTLVIDILDGFDPQHLHTFDVIAAHEISGTFSQILLPAAFPRLHWSLDIVALPDADYEVLRLTVTEATGPGALWLLLSGVAGLAVIGGRRWR